MKKRNKDILKLGVGWFVIFSTYLVTYFVPFLMGWNVKKNILGILLMVFPYTAGMLYYSIFCKVKSKAFYALGLLVPCIVEKTLIYLLSAFIYDINPLYFASVMQEIVDKGSRIRPVVDFKNGFLNYYPYAISFFSWGYVFGGLLLSIILTIFLVRSQNA